MEYLHGYARMRAARVPGSLTPKSAKPFTMSEGQILLMRKGMPVFMRKGMPSAMCALKNEETMRRLFFKEINKP